MADDMDFRLIGADTLDAEMRAAAAAIPDQVNTELRRIARDWKNSVNEKMPQKWQTGNPVETKTHKHAKKPLPKRWKTSFEYNAYGEITGATIVNTAPHWHLLENGHKKYDFQGNPTDGFVPGFHLSEKTRKEFEDTYPERMDAAIRAALEKAGL